MQTFSNVIEHIRYYDVLHHSVGALGVFSNGNSIVSILWEHEIEVHASLLSTFTKKHVYEFAQFDEQLKDYFHGSLKEFNVSATLFGSDFQAVVWQSLKSVNYGSVMSYEAFARTHFHASYTRAVANSLGKNPLPLIYPCHRIVPKKGGVGKYSGGSERKEVLIKMECKRR